MQIADKKKSIGSYFINNPINLFKMITNFWKYQTKHRTTIVMKNFALDNFCTQ